MSKRRISNETLKTTGFSYTHSGIPYVRCYAWACSVKLRTVWYTLLLINGKYKMTILYTLMGCVSGAIIIGFDLCLYKQVLTRQAGICCFLFI